MTRNPKGTDGLSLDRIVEAAVAFVDEHGLENLTMRALASSIGVFPTALYWYVDSKSRLVGLATSAVMSQVGQAKYNGTWQSRLREIAIETRTTLHQHPNFAPGIASQIHLDPAGFAPRIDAILGALEDAGFEGDEIVLAFNAFVGGVTGWICMELSAQPPAQARNEGWPEEYAASLSRQSTIDYPNMAKHLARMSNRAFMTRWESGTTKPLDRSFDFMVSTMLLGFHEQIV